MYFENNQNELIFADRRRRRLEEQFLPTSSEPYVPYDAQLERLAKKGIYLTKRGKAEYINKMSKERLQSLIETLEKVVSNNGGVRKHYYLDLLRQELRNRL